MSQEIIGYTKCDVCRGTGTNPDQTACTNCRGTGWTEVFRESTVVSAPPVQPSGRRRCPGYYSDLPVSVCSQQGQRFSGRCVVLAGGGVGAILPHSFPPGALITLQLSIPDSKTVLTTQAIVRNQEGLRHGFEFVSLNDSERAVIRQLCDGLMVQSDDGRKNS